MTRSRTSIVAALVLLALALLGIWIGSALDRRTSAENDLAQSGAPVESLRSAAADATDDRRAVGEATTGDESGLAAVRPSAILGPEPESGSPDGIAVHIVFGDTHDPVPGARVALHNYGTGEPPRLVRARIEERASSSTDKLAGPVEAVGSSVLNHPWRELIADEHGVVRVPRIGLLGVVARHDARGAHWHGALDVQASLRESSARVELFLERAGAIEIEVRANDGSPAAGVQVLLLATRSERVREFSPSLWRRGSDMIGVATTDAAGFASFRESGVRWADRTDIWATVGLPLDPSTRPKAELRQGGGALRTEARIQLPPTGTVRVRVPSALAGLAVHTVGEPMRYTGPAKDGIAAFERVGLGLDLESYDSMGDTANSVRFDGPRAEGEVVWADVPSAREVGPVAWLLVDPDGEALRHHVVERTSYEGESWAGRATTSTDELGAVHVWPQESDVWIESFGRAGAASQSVRLGAWILAEDLARGPTGPVVLHPLEEVGTGIVVDERGEPVADAELVLLEAHANDPSAFVGLGSVHLPRATATAESNGDGTFRLFARPPDRGATSIADTLRSRQLFAWKAGAPLAEPVPFVPGGFHKVVVARPAAVRGSIQAPKGLPRDSLEVKIHTQTGATTRLQWLDEAGDGERLDFPFFSPLAPSDARELVVHSSLDGSRIASWPLALRALEHNDAGLFELDGLIPTTRIHFEFEGGLVPATVSIDSPTSPPTFRTLRVPATGPTLVPSPVAPLAVRLSAHGFRDLDVELGTSDVLVVFQQVGSVRLTLPGGLAAIPERISITLWVGAQIEATKRYAPESVFPWPGEIHMPLAGPARLRVRFAASGSAKLLGPEVSLEVDAAALREGATLEIPVDPAEWSNWIEAAARKP
ncbi:MAG: hypothetical protein GC161_11490 [Planctomycetaceae bacterium]|nr:hypothetical protein [Planctomycetaceae bacterium]